MRDSTTSKEKILKKIRKALIHKSTQEIGDIDIDSEIFTASEESLEMQFAQNFTALNGKFIFCENETEFINKNSESKLNIERFFMVSGTER